jgi:1-deoxy-D-xylulose-5-phosphate reductoisomerase
VAVHAFLQGRLRFLGIAEVIERTLERVPGQRLHSFETLAAADAEARRVAAELVQALGSA